jgi:hypothetical protein
MATISCRRDGMDKRKVTCFLLLVVIGLACILIMVYILFYARPQSDSEIKNRPPRSEFHLQLPERPLPSPAVRS